MCLDSSSGSSEESTQNLTDKSKKVQDDETNAFMINEAEDLLLGPRFSSKYSQFSLNSAQLPTYITLKVANKILFTGELLQLFKSKSLNEIYSSGSDNNATQFSQNLSISKVQYVVDSNKCKFILK